MSINPPDPSQPIQNAHSKLRASTPSSSETPSSSDASSAENYAQELEAELQQLMQLLSRLSHPPTAAQTAQFQKLETEIQKKMSNWEGSATPPSPQTLTDLYNFSKAASNYFSSETPANDAILQAAAAQLQADLGE